MRPENSLLVSSRDESLMQPTVLSAAITFGLKVEKSVLSASPTNSIQVAGEAEDFLAAGTEILIVPDRQEVAVIQVTEVMFPPPGSAARRNRTVPIDGKLFP